MTKPLKMADLFCGAGGTSTGAVEAAHLLRRRPELTAINHWPVAVETHKANHPEARHLCTNIDEVNPRTLYRAGELDLLWASPECRFHSNARGGRPVLEQGRPTAFCVPRWLEAVRPRHVLVENVPEFTKWGPRKNGQTFRAWFEMCKALGYHGDWRVLCAADYGDPTTRRRLIVQFVRKGCGRIVWPEPTHADPERGPLPPGLLPWVPAEAIIDWRLKGQWLDEMPGKARFGGLPISPKTLARLYAGFEEHSGATFIVPKDNFDGRRTRSMRRPLHTVTASSRSEALVRPYLVEWDNTGGNNKGHRSLKRPLSTTVTKARHGLVQPFLVQLRGTSAAQVKASGRSLSRPLGTLTAGGGHVSLVEPFLTHTAHGGKRRSRSVREPLPAVAGNRGDLALCEAALLPQGQGGRLRSVRRPVPTIATDGAIALLEAYLVEYYGNGGAKSVRKPIPTIPTKDRFALVCPEVVVEGQRARVRFRWRMLQPHELAPGQGFRRDYRFEGNKSEQVKQIGNAVPRRLARALVLAALGQRSRVRALVARWKEAA